MFTVLTTWWYVALVGRASITLNVPDPVFATNTRGPTAETATAEGYCPTTIVPTTWWYVPEPGTMSITLTVPSPRFATYARAPGPDSSAIASGPVPTGTSANTFRLSTRTANTVFSVGFVTYARAPSGVTATSRIPA